MQVTITYKGKEITKEQICPGIVSYGEGYLLKCSVLNEWSYCEPTRFKKLIARFGDKEILGIRYISRAGKQVQTHGARKPKKEKAIKVPVQVTITASVPNEIPSENARKPWESITKHIEK